VIERLRALQQPLPVQGSSDSDRWWRDLTTVGAVPTLHNKELSVLFTMSACPPYAPFFGFAGVASAVSTRLPTRPIDCSYVLF
jgi:hypothetical protein